MDIFILTFIMMALIVLVNAVLKSLGINIEEWIIWILDNSMAAGWITILILVILLIIRSFINVYRQDKAEREELSEIEAYRQKKERRESHE